MNTRRQAQEILARRSEPKVIGYLLYRSSNSAHSRAGGNPELTRLGLREVENPYPGKIEGYAACL